MNYINGGVCAAKGFKATGIHCGIRKNKTKKDLALIVSDTRCAAASVYTTNLVKGAPITVTKSNISDGYAQAVICNSGNANTCNANGIEIACEMCKLVEKHTGISASDVICASTGVIGQPLDITPIATHMDELVSSLDYDGSVLATESYAYGTRVYAPEGLTPTRENDGENAYEFSGWDAELTKYIKRDMTYTATYNSRPLTEEEKEAALTVNATEEITEPAGNGCGAVLSPVLIIIVYISFVTIKKKKNQ